MNNFKRLMMITISIAATLPVIAYDKSADNSQPRHQGFGRIGTAVENTLTLHPGNAVNALATGNQSDTTFGWHEDDEGRVKANRAHTEHNRNKDIDSRDYENNRHLTYRQRRQLEADRKEQRRHDDRENKYAREERARENNEERGHWFWKSSN